MVHPYLTSEGQYTMEDMLPMIPERYQELFKRGWYDPRVEKLIKKKSHHPDIELYYEHLLLNTRGGDHGRRRGKI